MSIRGSMRSYSSAAHLALAAAAALIPGPLAGQWVQQNEQFYLPAEHNWVFRDNYMGADRLFNAFDYGHAILYEELWTKPLGPVDRLEVEEYDFLTRRLLRKPPRVPLEEAAIEIAYVKLAPEAKLMFEWAHVLHRQIYDVLADERLSSPAKDAAVAEVMAYYRSRPDLAFSPVPKSMDVMDGHAYSLVFRERYPKFNGLIWAYHWLQIGLYEPLLVNQDPASRTKGVNATVSRFWQMLEDAPTSMPYLMPMTAGVAPTFATRYPEAAIVFDNLHMMHDVISDILASPAVPRDMKRAEILRAAEMFRDETSYAISVEEWRGMGEMMGVHNMGGVAVGFLPELPTPTVPRGLSMAGMDHSAGATMGEAGADHAAHAATDTAGAMAGMDHGAMPGMPHEATDPAAPSDPLRTAIDRMLDDPVIRERVASDAVLMELLGAVGISASAATLPAGAVGASDQMDAMDFIVRLLADPRIESRIHQDPELHRLWSDPEVQARLEELRRMHPPTR